MSPPLKSVLGTGSERPRTVTAAVLVVALVGFLAWAMADVLLMVFAGTLIAVFLRTLSDGLKHLFGLPERWSMTIVLLSIIGLLVLGGWFLGAEIIAQMDQLAPRLGKAWGDVRKVIAGYDWGRTLLANISFKALARDKDWLTDVTGGVFTSTVGAVASVLVVFFIGVYAAVAHRTYLNGMLQLVPWKGRQRAVEVMANIGVTLRWWLLGTVAKMAMVGLATTIGLLLLDMPLALALGIIAFILEFVPYVGPIMAAVPALIIALAVSPMEMVYVGGLYLGVQAAENYIISPLVDQRSVNLPPVLTIVSQVLLGTSSLGVLGVFIATPLTAVVMVLVKMLYVEDYLGECTDAATGEAAASCVVPVLPEIGKETDKTEKGGAEKTGSG